MNAPSEFLSTLPRNFGMTLLGTFCACVLAVLFLTNWPTYHYTVRGGPLALYYYLLPCVLIVPILCAEPRLAVRFFREPLLWWYLIYVLTGVLWLLAAQDFIEDASQSVRMRLLALSFFYTVTIFVSVGNRSWIAVVILGCVGLACALNWFDVLRPERIVPRGVIVGVDQSGSGRGAGTFIDANAGAAFIVMGTMAALAFVPRGLRAVVLIGALVGIAPAYSRSGFVLFTVCSLAAMALGLVNKKQSLLLIVGIPVLVACISASYDYLLDNSENSSLQRVMQRLTWFEDPHLADQAVEGRAHGARVAWQMFLDNPLIGNGPGATSRDVIQEAPHNVYLELMAEQGFFGLALYVSLLGILARRGWRLTKTAMTLRDKEIGKTMMLFAVFLSMHGLFIHNVLREPYTAFVLAFVVATGFEAARREREYAQRDAAPRSAFAGSSARS